MSGIVEIVRILKERIELNMDTIRYHPPPPNPPLSILPHELSIAGNPPVLKQFTGKSLSIMYHLLNVLLLVIMFSGVLSHQLAFTPTKLNDLAPVVRRLDNDIHRLISIRWIARYVWLTHLLDSDVSDG